MLKNVYSSSLEIKQEAIVQRKAGQKKGNEIIWIGISLLTQIFCLSRKFLPFWISHVLRKEIGLAMWVPWEFNDVTRARMFKPRSVQENEWKALHETELAWLIFFTFFLLFAGTGKACRVVIDKIRKNVFT